MSIQQQLQTLLGNGVSPSVAAAAVGCTPAYVSQLLADPDFATKVAQARTDTLVQATARDNSYDQLEDRILKKLDDLLPFVIDPMKLVKMLQVINGAKRRGAGADTQGAAPVTNILVLQLPAQLREKFVLNEQQEVIEVAGRTLVTIDGDKLLQQTKQSTQNGSHTITRLAKAEI